MRGVALSLIMLLAACGSEPTPEERAAEAERDIALVQRANAVLPPVEEITPDPIAFSDMERYEINNAACNYAPGTSLGTRVIARPADAYMKLNGKIVRFAADPGAAVLPIDSRSRYIAKGYELQLKVQSPSADEAEEVAVGRADAANAAEEEEVAAPESAPEAPMPVNYEGTVTLRDEHGRIVYEGTGLAQCG